MPGGAPSKYKPAYCDKIVEYFDVEAYREVEEHYMGKDGKPWSKFVDKANDPRFLSAFARSIGVSHDTLLEWASKHKEFSVALKKAKSLQQEMFMINGLKGLFNTAFSIFSMKNMFGWRDKNEMDFGEKTLQTVKDLVLALAKGK